MKINYSKDNIFISKSEYLSNSISRLTVGEDAWERRERSGQEDEAEKLAEAKVGAFMNRLSGRGTYHPSSGGTSPPSIPQ